MNLGKCTYNSVSFSGQTKPDKAGFKHPDNGSVTVTNKNGDLCRLEYENGQIKNSYINNEQYKAYYRYKYVPNYATPDVKARHTFADGTKLDESQFWYDDGVQYARIFLSSKDEYWEIVKNNNPKYKHEPILTVKPEDKPAKIYVKSEGEEKFEFQSIEEAQDYFMKEYGIDARFLNLKTAFLMKEAVEEFVKSDPRQEDRIKYALNFLKIRYENSDNLGVKDGEQTYAFCRGNTIFINADYDWDNVEKSFLSDFIIEFHSSFLAKHIMTHELAHFFHFMESPAYYYKCCNEFQDDNEKMIAKKVSNYAMKNPREFVAEYDTGRKVGYAYPKEVDELYKKYHDPDICDICN